MSIEVLFRGPCVVVMKGNAVEDVRIPRGVGVAKHPDGTDTKQHHPGMFTLRAAGGEIQRIKLAKSTITITAGDASNGDKATGPVMGLPPVDQMANGVGANGSSAVRLRSPKASDFWDFTAAIVRFRGGTMSTRLPSKWKFALPTRTQPSASTASEIPLLTVWTTEAATATIVIEGMSSIMLTAGEKAYIYNWDTEAPTRAELEDTTESNGMPADPVVDADFLWAYELFVPPTGGWDGYLKENHLKQLPVPITAPDGKAASIAGENGAAPAASAPKKVASTAKKAAAAKPKAAAPSPAAATAVVHPAVPTGASSSCFGSQAQLI